MDIQTILSWVFGIATTLFGGLNIFQWLTLRSYKRIKEAEADRSEIDALRAIIDANTAEIGRLNQRIEAADRRAIEADNRYNKLYAEYYALKSEFEQYKITNSK